LSELFLIHDTIDLVKPKFAVEALFALADEPLRYADLLRCITNTTQEIVHPSTVIDSLRKLQDSGLLQHSVDDRGHATYRLTPMGRDLVPLLGQVHAWGQAHRDILDG